MIEGLHFDIKSAELKQHLEEKVKHHMERETFYNQQVDNLQKGGEDNTPPRFSGGSPIDNLRDKADSHKRKWQMFTFMKDHLVDETYRLTEGDLVMIEIISRGRW